MNDLVGGSRRSGILHAVAALALAASACGAAPQAETPAPVGPSKAAPTRVAPKAAEAAPEMAEPPYTAAQIREATRAGRTYVWAVDGDGLPPKRRTVRFVGADTSGALLEATVANPDGTHAVTEPATHVTWDELRDHAAFPKAAVTRSEGRAKTPAGEFDCFVYALRGKDGETTTFYFAKSMPGAPVLFSTEKGGKVIKKNELVEYRAGGAADVAAQGTAKVVSLKMAMKTEGDVDEKALVAALQSQLAPLDACAKLIERGVGSLNARITLTGQGPVSVRLESPVPPSAEKCLTAAFAAWKVTGAGTGQSMILLELAP